MLEIKNLIKTYKLDDKSSFDALKGINLTFPDVQFVSILGPSGCGKTTLLNLIGGLDSITEGDIVYNGRSIKNLKGSQLDTYRNSSVGFVFQNYFMIPNLSILENVKLSLIVAQMSEKEAEEKAREALKQVGLEGMEKKKPNQLSGGQQQRAAIARALIGDPAIILADEPTGALDSKTSIEIMALLKEISKKRLVIMVTHNEEIAMQYSQRIIRMQDGQIQKDELLEEDKTKRENDSIEKKTKLSFKVSLNLSLKNIFSKKWKSILTSVANSFGMIGIAFFLALNFGFSNYSTRISEESASSLPVVVTSYSSSTSSETRAETNASELYPSVDEIYPYVDMSSSTAYTYNNFTQKYFNYLDSLVEEGIISEYIKSYGNSFSFNLMTEFPDSIDGTQEGGLGSVTTTLTSYNYYASQAGLPTNIFHVLYGDLDQYDLLAGSLPESKNDLVLVVDKYNSVNFSILRNLGFYNMSDTQNDVKDTTLETNVKPISFDDIIGKTYKVFENNDYFEKTHTLDVTDAIGSTRTISLYSEKAETDTSFYENEGIELKITGIIRAKSTSSYAMLAPSLCYTSALQEELVPLDEASDIANDIDGNIVFKDDDDLTTEAEDFITSLEEIVSDYQNQKDTVLPTSKINSLLSEYFRYYSPFLNGNTYYMYSGFTTFLNDAASIGANIISDEIYAMDINDDDELNSFISQIATNLLQGDVAKAYEDIIGLVAYMNAYSVVEAIVIFPTDLTNRQVLLDRLDEFNVITEDSDTHASSSREVVNYQEENDNAMVRDVGNVISIVSTILVIFAIVSLTVSCSMTALLTSNNVLERRKEIGLLRSLGAREKDIGILFEIEAFIIGFFAGIIGSLITWVVSYPINSMMNYYYPSYNVGNICNFTWWHMLIVLAISIVIGLVSALIPSLKAAKENPVDCLRSE